jgi:hypothetical protein
MALKEQDVVLYSTDTSGNKVIQMPITRIENVEGAVKSVNGTTPDENGNVTVSVPVTSVDGLTGAVNLTNKYQPKGNYLTSAPVTSVNGKTGAVTIVEGTNRGVGRASANVTYSATKDGYTIPESGILSFTSTAVSEYGVDVYSGSTKLYTQPYTNEHWVDTSGEGESGYREFDIIGATMPVNAGETIRLVTNGRDVNDPYWRKSFKGVLMKMKTI